MFKQLSRDWHFDRQMATYSYQEHSFRMILFVYIMTSSMFVHRLRRQKWRRFVWLAKAALVFTTSESFRTRGQCYIPPPPQPVKNSQKNYGTAIEQSKGPFTRHGAGAVHGNGNFAVIQNRFHWLLWDHLHIGGADAVDGVLCPLGPVPIFLMAKMPSTALAPLQCRLNEPSDG